MLEFNLCSKNYLYLLKKTNKLALAPTPILEKE